MKGSTIKSEINNKETEISSNENAVSSIIGVLLMVSLTVLLATMVMIQANALTSRLEKIPIAYIDVKSNGDTDSADIKITHKGGDDLPGGDWSISIVPGGDSPVFRRSDPGYDIEVGDQIITTNLTNGNGIYSVTNKAISSDSPEKIVPGKYNVRIISYSQQIVLVDKTVEVT